MADGLMLRGTDGMEARFERRGAALSRLRVPDRDGTPVDVLLRAPPGGEPYFGAIVGRVANRLAGARVRIGGVEHALTRNDGAHHLHGGRRGLARLDWSAERIVRAGAAALRFRVVSCDGDEGYPGDLEVECTYALEPRALRIELEARTSRATVVNLTSHPYWNLAGDGATSALAHELWLDAERVVPVDRDGIPSAEPEDVHGGPFDFRAPRALGARLAEIAALRGGYDHYFPLRAQTAGLRLAARLRDPESGRTLELETTQPGVQLYTGNFLDGAPHVRHAGVCLEAMGAPNAPSTLLPGERYRHTIVYRFR